MTIHHTTATWKVAITFLVFVSLMLSASIFTQAYFGGDDDTGDNDFSSGSIDISVSDSPDPFNPSLVGGINIITINNIGTDPCVASLSIENTGRNWLLGSLAAGYNIQTVWNGRDEAGNIVPPGVYNYTATCEQEQSVLSGFDKIAFFVVSTANAYFLDTETGTITVVDGGSPVPFCGNGILETGEECDWSGDNGYSCSAGYNESCQYCSNECQFIKIDGPYCGDGIKNGGEECDGNDFGGQSCESFGFDDGSLSCNDFCQIVTSGCSNIVKPQCSDRIDNDGDGLIDMNDAGCENAEDDDESDDPVPALTITLPPNNEFTDGKTEEITVQIFWDGATKINGEISIKFSSFLVNGLSDIISNDFSISESGGNFYLYYNQGPLIPGNKIRASFRITPRAGGSMSPLPLRITGNVAVVVDNVLQSQNFERDEELTIKPIESSLQPATVTNIQVLENNNIIVHWTNGSPGITSGFLVTRSIDGGIFHQIAGLNADVLSYTDIYTVRGKEHCYAVRSVTYEGQEVGSNMLCATVPLRLTPVVIENIIPETDGTITMSWSDSPESLADGYRLFRSINQGAFTQIQEVNKEVAFYHDQTTTPGAGHCYFIRSYTNNETVDSNQACITANEVLDPDPNPSILPRATTKTATDVTDTSAVLHGTINPNGLAAKAFFTWGETETSQNPTMPFIEISMWAARASISKTISGLQPNTTYLYRMVGTNVNNTVFGGYLEFTTLGEDGSDLEPGLFSITSADAYCDTQEPVGPAVRLEWEASAGAESYEIYRNGDKYTTLSSSDTTFENNIAIVVGEEYEYYIKAINDNGETDSNKVTVEILEDVCDGEIPEELRPYFVSQTENPLYLVKNGGLQIVVSPKAYDKDGNDISDKIIKDGWFDNTQVGTYEIKYNVVDDDGIAAHEYVQVVIIHNSPQLYIAEDVELGFEDGVEPDIGGVDDIFTFKVVYSDEDNDAPTDILAHMIIGNEMEDFPMALDTEAIGVLRDGSYINGEQYTVEVSFWQIKTFFNNVVNNDQTIQFKYSFMTGDSSVSLTPDEPVGYILGNRFEPIPYGYSFSNGSYIKYENEEWIYNPLYDLSIDSKKIIFDEVFDLSNVSDPRQDKYIDKLIFGASGNCFGMSATSLLEYEGSSIFLDSRPNANYIYQLNQSRFIGNDGIRDREKIWDGSGNINTKPILKNIVKYQVAGYASMNKESGTHNVINTLLTNSLPNYVLSIKNISGDEKYQDKKHALVPYEVKTVANNEYEVKVYDPNCPGSNEKFVKISKKNIVDWFWEYQFTDDSLWAGGNVLKTSPFFDKSIELTPVKELYNSGQKFKLPSLWRVKLSGIMNSVYIEDSEGRITGYNNGSAIDEIPGVEIFVPSNGNSDSVNFDLIFTITEDREDYKYYIESNEDNSPVSITKFGEDYYLQMDGVLNNNDIWSATSFYGNKVEIFGFENSYNLEVNKDINGDANTFNVFDIPTSPAQTHQYTINWEALSQGEYGVTVQIDADGDGNFEETIITGATFQPPVAPEAPTADDEPNQIAYTAPSGGGGLPPALSISGSSIGASAIEENTATISWLTSLFSTSRVIYSSEDEIHNFDLDSSLNYGYAHSTEETSTKATGHHITLHDLYPGITYYYRCISASSPDVIGSEHSFITLGVKKEETEEGAKTTEGLPAVEHPEQEKTASSPLSTLETPPFEEEVKEVIAEIKENPNVLEEDVESVAEKPEQIEKIAEALPAIQKEIPNRTLLASLSVAFVEISQSTFLVIVVILCVIGLILVGIRKRRLFYKKK